MRFWPFLLVGAVILAGCRSSVTYPSPSVTSAATDDRVEPATRALMESFGLALVEEMIRANPEREGTVSPWLAQRQYGALLRGSDTQTNAALRTVLGVSDEEIVDFEDGIRLSLDALNGETGAVKSGAAVWLVWPYQPSRSFIALTYQALETDVIRLGSAGIGARQEMERWSRLRTGNEVGDPIGGLNQRDILVTTGVLWLSETAPLEWRVGSGATIEAAFGAAKRAKPVERVELRSEESLVNLLPTLRAMGGSRLLELDNDYRMMASEMNRRTELTRASQAVTVAGSLVEAQEQGWRMVLGVEPKSRVVVVAQWVRGQ